MENPNQPNLDKQPENQPSGAQEALQQAEQTLRDATQSQPYTGSSDISQDDKNVAMLAHLLAPFFGFIPPLIFTKNEVNDLIDVLETCILDIQDQGGL